MRMKNELPSSAESKLAEAMALMRQALQLLDAAQAPADIGAHLDLAIVRLGEAMAKASDPWSKIVPPPELRAASGSS